MDVSVIIINYNSGEVTKKAINNILNQKGVELEVIVADNDSHDNSLEIFETYGNKIKLIANRENLGYGKACNQASKIATGRYLTIINPDALFCSENGLLQLTKYMDLNPKIGLSGSKIRNHDESEETLSHMFYPGENYIKNRFDHFPGKIAWSHGAMLFIRHDVFNKINGFDEDYFLFCEDTDIALRIRKAGFEIGCCHDAMIRHIGAVSYKKTDSYLVKTRKVKGTYLFYKKHYSEKEAKKLLRAKCWKSLFRMSTLRLSLLFKTDEIKENKYRRYKATFDLARDFLKN